MSSSNFSIRPATLADASSISALGITIFTATFGHSCTAEQLQSYLDQSYSPAAIANDISNPDKDFYVATSISDEKEHIVGFSLLTRNSIEPCIAHLSKPVELQRLYVGLDQQGRGVGKALAVHIERVAREQGFEHMWLGVWEENFKAQGVYEKLGYVRCGEHVFDVGGDLQTDLILWKRL